MKSSHVSGAKTFPSPHIGEHFVALYLLPPEQVKVGRGPVHVLLHPTSSFDPSSQVSYSISFPSPQKGVHIEGEEELPPVQFHKSRVPEQSDLHPLLSVKLSSSQISDFTLHLSPQIGVHFEAGFELDEQFHPTKGLEQSD